jgi:UV DNA damage repair endonuclease
MTHPRIGFCCKWIDDESQIDGFKPGDVARELNTRVTTVAWLNRQTRDVAEQRLWDLMVHNIQSIKLLIERIGSLDAHRRMVRLGSDILPVYTEPTWSYFWRRSDVRAYCEKEFAKVGTLGRQADVRLSFHPGQFCVLASHHADIVARSLEEFEYHADMVRWMGYGTAFQDFKINVHISGREGPAGVRRALQQLSPEARNCITIENDETKHGVDASLELVDDCALVLDIHHHWVRTGEYLEPDDDRVKRIKDSWRGVRPAMHYSVSREDVLVDHDPNVLPNLAALMDSGVKRGHLRGHSDFYWNSAVNDWALSFAPDFDIQLESKGKNLARDRLLAENQNLRYYT